MVNYQSAKIYKITGGGFTYIGSTTTSLSRRLAHHRNDLKRFKEGKRQYELTSFRVFEHPDYAISLIEKYPCEDNEELYSRERYWIENTDCVNRFIPNRRKAEYYQDNKEIILEKNKIYRVENAEGIQKQRAEYKEQNRETLREKQRIYREQHKEEISKKLSEFFISPNEIIETCNIFAKGRSWPEVAVTMLKIY
jgi:predicted GIY-YIG superfamily endonuclease